SCTPWATRPRESSTTRRRCSWEFPMSGNLANDFTNDGSAPFGAGGAALQRGRRIRGSRVSLQPPGSASAHLHPLRPLLGGGGIELAADIPEGDRPSESAPAGAAGRTGFGDVSRPLEPDRNRHSRVR